MKTNHTNTPANATFPTFPVGGIEKILILLILVIFVTCSTRERHVEIFQLTSAQGDIIYEGISNSVFYERWPSGNLKVNFRAKENCVVKDNGSFLDITPKDSVTYAIIEAVFEDSIKRDYLFKVKKLPEPRLYYNLDTEIEKQMLPNTIKKKDIHHLFSLEALTPIGSLSWINFEIERFEILVLRGDKIIARATNIGPDMSNDNRQLCLTLDANDVLFFRNIALTQGGSEKEWVIHEKSITIE